MPGIKKVSVCVMTYNQAQYIGQCLQSLVDQEVNFDYEILVSDDASSDSTPDIVREFQLKYPELFRVFLHETNKGVSDNYHFVHQQATGQYIAHVDGDDYFLPNKLQKQADFLDENSQFNIVWHRMLVELPDGTLRKESDSEGLDSIYTGSYGRSEIIQFIAVGANSSKMYRKSVRDFEDPGFDAVDYYANVEQVGDGYAGFACTEPLGVYRSGIGISSVGSKTREILYKCFIFFSKKYPEYRLQVNTAALTYLVADMKNRRSTWPMFLKAYFKTFHPLSVFNFVKSLRFISKLKVRK
ncbi:glycosyltransferase family 2 protein [Pseudomonas sp. NUPR-001]|uniref:glycosyltransferase family 2 protein n=1 Tax=Pseudomonas sp. NUPR-001 TaxID=3416058 RepID=UPI003F96963B